MDTRDLAAAVPAFMARHPEHEWTVVSPRKTAVEDLVLSLYPAAAPERAATIHVAAGAEVFTVTFAGHTSPDFAYDDANQSDMLRERIDLAAAATLGPTRVILERAGGSIISSTMIIDPDGPHRYEDARVRWPLRRLKARIMRRHVDRRVVDFPAILNG